MKLVKGRTYRTRSGKEHKVHMNKLGPDYPWSADGMDNAWYTNGRTSKDREYPEDLVECIENEYGFRVGWYYDSPSGLVSLVESIGDDGSLKVVSINKEGLALSYFYIHDGDGKGLYSRWDLIQSTGRPTLEKQEKENEVTHKPNAAEVREAINKLPVCSDGKKAVTVLVEKLTGLELTEKKEIGYSAWTEV